MPARRNPYTCYPDEVVEQQFEQTVKPYYVKKNEGLDVTISYVLRELIREKFYDIKNEQTRSLTIKKVYEEVVAMREEVNWLTSSGIENVRPKQGLVQVNERLGRIENRLEYFINEGLKLIADHIAKEESNVR